MTIAMKVEGWLKARPAESPRPDRRQLRLREGGRRLTTKPQSQQGKKKWK